MMPFIKENREITSLVLIVGSMFAFSMLVFPLFYASANQSDGLVSGNLNYRVFNLTGKQSFLTPNDKVAWSTSFDGLSQSADGSHICFPQCFSIQFQLFDSGGPGGNIIYQESLDEFSQGSVGCTTNQCNYYCITDANSNSSCIAASFFILPNDNLGAAGWSEQFYTTLGSGGNIITFWLQVLGPGGFNDLFTISDSYQKPVYGIEMNIVGACCQWPKGVFTFGAGTATYNNVVRHYKYVGGAYTSEYSNMAYGSMIGHGSYFTQSYHT
jgi:hypothetical protein